MSPVRTSVPSAQGQLAFVLPMSFGGAAMTVADWAKRQVETFTGGPPSGVGLTSNEWDEAVQMGYNEAVATGVHLATTLADRLLSDEAVDALRHEADRHSRNAALATAYQVGCTCGSTFAATQEGWFEFYRHGRRAALQAAIDAATREEDGNDEEADH